MTQLDPEIMALNQTYDALKELNKAQVSRIIGWIQDRFGIVTSKPIKENAPVSLVEPEKKEETQEDEEFTSKPSRTQWENEDEFKSEREKEKNREKESRGPGMDASGLKKTLKDFATTSELFSEVRVKSMSSKILLMAAYLQEKMKYKEVGTTDIVSALKKLNLDVDNVSHLVGYLIKKDPPVFIKNKTSDSKQARLKLRVSEHGLKEVRQYLKQYQK